MELMNCTVRLTPDACEIGTGTRREQVPRICRQGRGSAGSTVMAGNTLGGAGRRLEPAWSRAQARQTGFGSDHRGRAKRCNTTSPAVYRDTISASLRTANRRLEAM
jgi:hypothetical protein